MGEGADDCGGGISGEDVYTGKAEPVLVLVSDSYSNDEVISVSDSRSSSYSAYTATDYCPKRIVCYFDLRRSFYSKQGF